MSDVDHIRLRAAPRALRFTMSNLIVGVLAVATGCVTMSLLAAAIGSVYLYAMYGGGPIIPQAVGGFAVGLFYAAPFIARREYTIPAYLRGAHRPSRIFVAWNTAFLALLAIAFLTQTTLAMSRVTAVLFYAIGLIGMIALESGMRSVILTGLRTGRLMPRRIMLVGAKLATLEFIKRLAAASPEDTRVGVRIIATAELPMIDGPEGTRGLKAALNQALVTARAMVPDEVVLVSSWDDPDFVEAVVGTFGQLPVAIHVDAGPVLGQFSALQLRRVGGVSTLSIAELPLSPIQVIAKRSLDIVGATLGLILLSPLFLLIALAIKRDRTGDVFFFQDRRGFNQETFKIVKFRTMSTADNGAVINQATADDLRVTRIGRLLRRTSLDELPQLLNVLIGDMSLVGPRPHAVAHDRDYERRIRHYPRRLNMKPGITGWAQVNGLRGLTDTDDKMRRRVEADLYYIDNWSVLLDVYILLLTVCSPKTFRNAH
jgi:polysaccharide biosynthesis protein PslA